MRNSISRRKFLVRAAQAGGSFYLLPHGIAAAAAEPADPGASPVPAGLSFFSDDERETLSILSHHVFPNAQKLGAVAYVETFLSAFDFDPPRIYAGGPYSGRKPFSRDGVPTDQYPPDSFADFLPLNRVQETAWKLRLYGSASIPGGWWNESVLGPVVGLRDLVKQGIRDSTGNGSYYPSLSSTSSDFQTEFTTLVLQACFSAPEYGGNTELHGWRISHYPGDSQPLGYSLYDEATGAYRQLAETPVSDFDSTDPDKMGFLTRCFCGIIAVFQGGRIF